MVIAPCLTVKPHPEWSLVTEPSVYIMRPCCYCFLEWEAWSLTLSTFSLLAIIGMQCFLRFSGRIECLIVVPKMVWVSFPSLISFSGQLATQDLPRPSLHLFVSFTDFWMGFADFQQYWSNALTSSTLCLVCTSFCLVYIVSATGSNVKDATRQPFLLSSLVRSELRWHLTPKERKFGERKALFCINSARASELMEMCVHFVLFGLDRFPI